MVSQAQGQHQVGRTCANFENGVLEVTTAFSIALGPGVMTLILRSLILDDAARSEPLKSATVINRQLLGVAWHIPDQEPWTKRCHRRPGPGNPVLGGWAERRRRIV